ncbi:MAG: hypothetical protein IJI03_14640, partial [Rudaea sp.]|nr:hypothetical protein [Rudaea sp.]
CVRAAHAADARSSAIDRALIAGRSDAARSRRIRTSSLQSTPAPWRISAYAGAAGVAVEKMRVPENRAGDFTPVYPALVGSILVSSTVR